MNIYHLDQINFLKLFDRNDIKIEEKQEVACAMLRLNILSAIQNAGSGHLGTSFSALEIMLSSIMHLENYKLDNNHFFSSKGHDVPALYACYEALGKLPNKSLTKLRRLNGLPGHPDVATKNILFNTGSLGMGLSKANGWLCGHKYAKQNAQIIVLIGDGEFQEGQNFEALMYLQNHKDLNPLIIMDANKIQSDTWVNKVKSFESLRQKIEAFGLNFIELDGHNLTALNEAYSQHFCSESQGASFILANTIKGKGVPFAETSTSFEELELYGYHSGAMSESEFDKANDVLKTKINQLFEKYSISSELKPKSFKKSIGPQASVEQHNLLLEYTSASVNFLKQNANNVALNADLVKDAGSLEIKRQLPGQFFEFGIAEQDMVSFASGLAASGLIPWCHSFACFLTTRAQEQIFNFCSENRKGIFVGALAGPIPAGPGHSHQMVRDLSIMSSMPNLRVFEPVSLKMVRDIFNKQKDFVESLYIRLANCNLNLRKFSELVTPPAGDLAPIIPIKEQTQKIVILQGAILVSEVISILEEFENRNNIAVFAAVWLSDISEGFLKLLQDKDVYIFETSVHDGDYASRISLNLSEKSILPSSFFRRGLSNLPECGQNEEVLRFHLLDGNSILETVTK